LGKKTPKKNKKTQKTPKNPKKTKKEVKNKKTHWAGFFLKPGFFPTLHNLVLKTTNKIST
jgi:hypothetical protein